MTVENIRELEEIAEILRHADACIIVIKGKKIGFDKAIVGVLIEAMDTLIQREVEEL